MGLPETTDNLAWRMVALSRPRKPVDDGVAVYEKRLLLEASAPNADRDGVDWGSVSVALENQISGGARTNHCVHQDDEAGAPFEPPREPPEDLDGPWRVHEKPHEDIQSFSDYETSQADGPAVCTERSSGGNAANRPPRTRPHFQAIDHTGGLTQEATVHEEVSSQASVPNGLTSESTFAETENLGAKLTSSIQALGDVEQSNSTRVESEGENAAADMPSQVDSVGSSPDNRRNRYRGHQEEEIIESSQHSGAPERASPGPEPDVTGEVLAPKFAALSQGGGGNGTASESTCPPEERDRTAETRGDLSPEVGEAVCIDNRAPDTKLLPTDMNIDNSDPGTTPTFLRAEIKIGTGFVAGRNSRLAASSNALRRAQEIISQDQDPARPTVAAGRVSPTIEDHAEADTRKRKLLQSEPTPLKLDEPAPVHQAEHQYLPMAGFSTGAGKSLKVSEAAMSRAKKLLQQDEAQGQATTDASNPPMVGFSTGAGKSLKVSEAAMSRAKKLLLQDEDKVEAAPDASNLPMAGFSAGGGKSLQVSEAAMSRAKKLLQEDEAQGEAAPDADASNLPLAGFSTSTGKSLKVSEAAMSRAKKLLRDDEHKGEPAPGASNLPMAGFSTGGGKSLKVSEAAMSRAKKLLQQEDAKGEGAPDESTLVPSRRFDKALQVLGSAGTVPSIFSSARGEKLKVSAGVLQKAKQVLEGNRDSDRKKPSSPDEGQDEDGTAKGSSTARGQRAASGGPNEQLKSLSEGGRKSPQALMKHTVRFASRTPLQSRKNQRKVAADLSLSKSSALFKAPRKMTKPIERDRDPIPLEGIDGPVPLGTIALGLNGEILGTEGLKKARRKTRDIKIVPRIIEQLVGEECSFRFRRDRLGWDSPEELAAGIRTIFLKAEPQVIIQDLLDSGSVGSSSICAMMEELFRNHTRRAHSEVDVGSGPWCRLCYRLLVHKLIFEETTGGSVGPHQEQPVTLKNLLLAFSRRIHREWNQAVAPPLLSVVRRDALPSAPLVVAVYRIYPDTYEMDVTDGWHIVRMATDTGLRDVIMNSGISVGSKLFVVGASLESRDPEAQEETRRWVLKVEHNCVYRAKLHAKLGFRRYPPVVRTLERLKAGCGTVPIIRVVVKRVYPQRYLETLEDGTRIFRGPWAEESAQRKHEQLTMAGANGGRERIVKPVCEARIVDKNGMQALLSLFDVMAEALPEAGTSVLISRLTVSRCTGIGAPRNCLFRFTGGLRSLVLARPRRPGEPAARAIEPMSAAQVEGSLAPGDDFDFGAELLHVGELNGSFRPVYISDDPLSKPLFIEFRSEDARVLPGPLLKGHGTVVLALDLNLVAVDSQYGVISCRATSRTSFKLANEPLATSVRYRFDSNGEAAQAQLESVRRLNEGSNVAGVSGP